MNTINISGFQIIKFLMSLLLTAKGHSYTCTNKILASGLQVVVIFFVPFMLLHRYVRASGLISFIWPLLDGTNKR